MLREQSILPAWGQLRAVGEEDNVRALNVSADADDVVRRVPLAVMVDGKPVPALAVELAARALGAQPQVRPDQGMTLEGYRIPEVAPNTLTINFEGGSQDIPTYSLADLRACMERGDKEFFRRNFNGKVVIFGAVLEAEDRKVTSKRFATAPEKPTAERCALPAPPTTDFTPRAIPGPYVHATAVNNLIRHDALVEAGPLESGAIAAGFAAAPAFAALLLPPVGAVAAFLMLAAAWTLATVAAFQHTLVLPLLELLFAGLAALFVMIGFRLAVTDKDRRFLLRSFSLYLAPAVIKKMQSSRKLPSLGGEARNVTMFFSDVAGFSSFAETMPAADLIALMNVYLSAMTDIIEARGGFVDKYIGDAIVGVFGAPIADDDHATAGVLAALSCCERLAELNKTAPAFKGHMLGHRIELNSGEALVGNWFREALQLYRHRRCREPRVAARRREQILGTSILASEATVSLTGASFRWRESISSACWAARSRFASTSRSRGPRRKARSGRSRRKSMRPDWRRRAKRNSRPPRRPSHASPIATRRPGCSCSGQNSSCNRRLLRIGSRSTSWWRNDGNNPSSWISPTGNA